MLFASKSHLQEISQAYIPDIFTELISTFLQNTDVLRFCDYIVESYFKFSNFFRKC